MFLYFIDKANVFDGYSYEDLCKFLYGYAGIIVGLFIALIILLFLYLKLLRKFKKDA